MRIENLHIENFRGIRRVSLSDLRDTVVIAGANGSGKSAIFDAVRLLKSVYGGYQQNEWHQWMGEFQVNFTNRPESFANMFQDRGKRLTIRCSFRLHPNERLFLRENAAELVRHSVWRVVAPELHGWSSYRAASLASHYRELEPEVAKRTSEQLQILNQELAQDLITGEFFIDPGAQPQIVNSKVLELLFSTYEPGSLGLIDYHGAQRFYGREQVGGINLNLDAHEQSRRQHALYNYANKYTNVKTEMSSSFVQEVLAQRAGADIPENSPLSETLKELFETFFPDKEFLGAIPTKDGRLEFPVRTLSGAVHDLDELSAGEKEVLYGYLRIRNSAPRYSIIMIDEPELHLNPRLIKGLPAFYHNHLGLALDNQIWLISHSDALLREVVGRPEYSVFHMMPASKDLSVPQIKPLQGVEEVEQAVINLIGDLASYRPGEKVVIFEGGGDTEFDILMATDLFPNLPKHANLISGGNKPRVRDLHDVLQIAASQNKIPFKVLSIVDQDGESDPSGGSAKLMWDVYHIENYLLSAKYIREVARNCTGVDFGSDSKVQDELRNCAAKTLPALIRHELQIEADRALVRAITPRPDNKAEPAAGLHAAISTAFSRVSDLIEGDLSLETVQARALALKAKLEADLGSETWMKTFRGRDILKAFVADQLGGAVKYETFRNLIVARMRDDNFQPEGMKRVVDHVISF